MILVIWVQTTQVCTFVSDLFVQTLDGYTITGPSFDDRVDGRASRPSCFHLPGGGSIAGRVAGIDVCTYRSGDGVRHGPGSAANRRAEIDANGSAVARSLRVPRGHHVVGNDTSSGR